MKLITLAITLLVLTATITQAVEYRLPFDGQWFVMAGGDTINVNHHMAERSQWFAVDFMKTGGTSNRAVASGNGKSLTDYYSWGQPVLSPVEGTVRKIHDTDADNPIGTTDKNNAFGNFVMIEASPTEFVYLAHFQKGSVAVKEGAKVKSGQLLGKCGNSGNTSGPHIHMHVQDQSKPYAGTGQNITFHGIHVLLSGKQFDNVDWPLLQGLFVRQGKVK
jgi:Peptidase family M23